MKSLLPQAKEKKYLHKRQEEGNREGDISMSRTTS